MFSDLLGTALRGLRASDPPRRLSQLRRVLLILRIRVSARWHRATVDLDIAPDIRLGRQVVVTIEPRSHNILRIGPKSHIENRVTILLKGGEILLGPRSGLRHGALLNVSGRLELTDTNVLSWGCVLHCAESVRFEPLAGAAEYVTIADSTHYFTGPDEYFYDNVRTKPIVIGPNTWLCPKATITSGVTVGGHCIIASNSVVTTDVPDGHLASGVPATAVRSLRLPWLEQSNA